MIHTQTDIPISIFEPEESRSIAYIAWAVKEKVRSYNVGTSTVIVGHFADDVYSHARSGWNGLQEFSKSNRAHLGWIGRRRVIFAARSVVIGHTAILNSIEFPWSQQN